MTYNAEVQFKFDATFTPTYGSSSWADDDFIPEEHYLITAPAADLNAKQYFKLFEKFMLCVGMCPSSIRSGAMSLVFNDMVLEEEQRKVCKEYELTMDEDLRSRFEEFKEADEAWAKLKKGPMGTVLEDDGMRPWGHSDLEYQDWKSKFEALHRRFRRFASLTDKDLDTLAEYWDTKVASQYTEEEMNAMCDAAEEKEKCREYNMREAEYYDKRAQLDLQQQTDLRNT